MADYTIPIFGGAGPRLHGWLTEAVQEGRVWLDTQRPARNWQRIIDLLSSDESVNPVYGSSDTGYNKTKRIARELVASLGTFRHEGEFVPDSDDSLYQIAHVLTRIDKGWYRTTSANLSYRANTQNAVAFGTGYIGCEWDKNFRGPFKGDIRQTAYGPGDVTFIQLPRDHDMQRAYAVIIRDEMPINLARAIYAPTNKQFADSLVPDRDSPGWIQKGLRKVQEWMSPALRVSGAQKRENTSFPTVDIYRMYTMDGSINDGIDAREMGAMGTNWRYNVPRLGQMIPTGQMAKNGQSMLRPATEEDCLLFPLRRLTIFSLGTPVIAYDGSSPWWHGKVPLARLRFSDWPWEALGQSLLSDPAKVQTGVVELLRLIEDACAARLDPPALYDEMLTSEGFAQKFNPRLAGVRASANLQSGTPITFPVPVQHYEVPQGIFQHVHDQEARMDYLAGVQDLTALAKAKQIPSSDSIEKLLEMAGPIVQDMVEAIKQPLQELGEMRLSYYFQFMTKPRIIQETGDEAYPLLDYDFVPDQIKPENDQRTGAERIRDEEIARSKRTSFKFTPDMIVPNIEGEDNSQKTERMRRYVHEFHYHISRSGMNDIFRMTTKLFYLQLMKEGFPISWWTFAQIAEIPNFGPPPQGTHTELERYIAQTRMKMELQNELAQEQAAAQGGAAPGGAAPAGGSPMTNGTGRPGRPQTYREAPQLRTKDGGTRTTVETS